MANNPSVIENDGEKTSVGITAQIHRAVSMSEAGDMVLQALLSKLFASAGIPTQELGSDKPMHQYGVDSMVSIEIRNWVSKKVGADMGAFDISWNLGIQDVTTLAAGKSAYTKKARTETP